MSTDARTGAPSGPHLGDDAAALADGQLRGAARDRALGHVATCADCRAEVAAQRGLKALVALPTDTDAPASLQASLLSMNLSSLGGLAALADPPAPAAPSPGRSFFPRFGFGAAALVDGPSLSRSRTRSFVLTGVAVGVLGGGLTMAVTRGADAPGMPGSPSGGAGDLVPTAVQTSVGQPVVHRVPTPVRVTGQTGRTVPLVADLLGR